MIISLDESGDLGWNFTAPYRRGGSSRHLTIASLLTTPDKKHLPKRLIQKLYKKFSWDPAHERKWSEMTVQERLWFAKKAAELKSRFPDEIKYLSITVRKENVLTHIREDANKLYNYMIGLSLLEEMSKHPTITLVPDPRSIKVQSGRSLHDYLQTQLWFELKTATRLNTIPIDSANNRSIQFADMLSGVVQSYFEDGNSRAWVELKSAVTSKTLFF